MLEIARCVVCTKATDFSVDIGASDRPQASPSGSTIRCSSCDLFACGNCISTADPTQCKSCATCDACGGDKGALINVDARGVNRKLLSGRREDVCLTCYRDRAVKLAFKDIADHMNDPAEGRSASLQRARDLIEYAFEAVA